MSNSLNSNKNDTQIIKSKNFELHEASISNSAQGENLENQKELLKQSELSGQHLSFQEINESQSQQSSLLGPANQKLLEQQRISQEFKSVVEKSSGSLQSQQEVHGKGLNQQHSNYSSIQQQQIEGSGSDLSGNQNIQAILAPSLFQCQQAFFYILEKMITFELQTPGIKIKFELQTPGIKIKFDKEIEGYLQLKQKLQKDDLEKLMLQEKELLEFFQGWFSYEREIEKLQTKSNGNIQQDLNIDYKTSFNFENECIKNFKNFILNKKNQELEKFKQLYLKQDTLNNWKQIIDELNINNIQVFIMLCIIKDKDPQNKFAHFYLQWWFDWNQTSVFIKTKEIYQ